MSETTLSTSHLPDDRVLDKLFAGIVNGGVVPVKDKANSGPNDDDAIRWMEDSLAHLDDFDAFFPDVFVTSDATYEVKA